MKKPTLSPKMAAVLQSLTSLGVSDLDEVVKRAHTLRSALGARPDQGPALVPPQMTDDWVLAGIYDALAKMDRKFLCVPYAKLAAQRVYRDYYSALAPNIMKALESKLPTMSPPEKIYMGRLFGGLFLAYVLERGGGDTLNGLLYRIDQYVGAIDNAFPGYIDSGLLPMLLQQLQSERRVAGA